jgi:hypothetical protein
MTIETSQPRDIPMNDSGFINAAAIVRLAHRAL